VENPVSKFSFQVHNLQRYTAAMYIKFDTGVAVAGVEVGLFKF
jgi:hypothetical protein